MPETDPQNARRPLAGKSVHQTSEGDKNVLVAGDLNAGQFTTGPVGTLQLHVDGRHIGQFDPSMLVKRAELPDLAPFMVDRQGLMDRLSEALKDQTDNPTRPLLCVFQGNSNQAHDKLIRRIAEEEIPRKLNLSGEGVTLIQIPWPGSLGQADNFNREMTRTMGMALAYASRGGMHGEVGGVSEESSLDELQAAVQSIPRPTVLFWNPEVTSWEEPDLEAVLQSTLVQFLRYWSDWPSGGQDRRLIVVLAVKYGDVPEDTSFFSRIGLRRSRPPDVEQTVEQILTGLETYDDEALCVYVLPKLEEIELRDVLDWRQLASNRKWPAPSERSIRELFKEHQKKTGRDSMPMDVIGEQLHKLTEKEATG